jgi:hypothetical protein
MQADQMKDIFDFPSPASSFVESPALPSAEQVNEPASSTEYSQSPNSIGSNSSCSPFPSLSLHVSLPVDDKAHAGNELWDELLHSLESTAPIQDFPILALNRARCM